MPSSKPTPTRIPISEERLASWSEWDGYEITHKAPEGEWLETFAPPGHPDPSNHRADVEHRIRKAAVPRLGPATEIQKTIASRDLAVSAA